MVKTGLDSLISERLDLVLGRRVGVVSHPAAVLPDFTGIVDALRREGVRVTALFGPEHGFAGDAADGAAVENSVDARTGLPVYSLYGPVKEPTPEMLAGVDVLVFDMQDIGARFYTFVSTLLYVLRGAAKAGKPVIVLDRPTPINGVSLEGPLVKAGLESFVGILPIPIRYGMTMGELARYANTEFSIGAELTVIELRGWQRAMWFDQSGLPWVTTSPAMPHLSTATLYPGMCLLEGTNLSEGRGTSLPFEICGAPWIDEDELVKRLNALCLPGARFRPHRFQPTASKHAGELCGGVQVHLADRNALHAVALGLHLIATIQAMYPGKIEWSQHFDLLAGTLLVRQAIEASEPVEAIVNSWQADLARFAEQRRAYLLYK